MNPIWKLFMAAQIRLYRLTRGRLGSSVPWLSSDMGLLLLTTTGHKSGKFRTAILGYFVDGDRYITVGSNAGLPTDPAWLVNIRSRPQVTIQVRDRVLAATGAVAGPEERARLWPDLMKIGPGYARYETMTAREIPLVVLSPVPAAPIG